MRLLINFLVISCIGLALGAYSAQYALNQSYGIGAIQVGSWSAKPFVGGAAIDPYTAARYATDGTLPIGAAEGLVFEAQADEAGDILDLECHYKIVGSVPQSRVWTLAAYSQDREIVTAANGNLAAVHSASIVRSHDNSFEVFLNRSPSSGNWIAISGTGSFKLLLRVYDTPISNNSEINAPQMPKIIKQACS